ncbi:MAG: SPOR domain-containing protein [Nitrospinae bacterium]|nr:SPOR domain-containing protein [Nitrospinota bacterium]
MRFFLVLIFVMASGAGLHFSGVIKKFQESTTEKVRAVKPESIRNKVKKPEPDKPVYTFFETLVDPTMTQYVDLKGGMKSTALPPEKNKVVPAKIKVTPVSLQPVNKTAKLEPAIRQEQKPKIKTRLNSEAEAPIRYAVQVSSFRDEGRAGALKMRLQKKGFDAFLMKTELADNGGTWHRVFLGRYAEEQKAKEAANLVKTKYKLNAVVVRNTN